MTSCCATMRSQLNYQCPQHKGNNCPDLVIILAKSGKYFLRAPNATYSMAFCPWCGKKLSKAKKKARRKKLWVVQYAQLVRGRISWVDVTKPLHPLEAIDKIRKLREQCLDKTFRMK